MKEELVDEGADEDEIAAFMENVFGGSGEVVENPSDSTIYDVVCWLQYGGLCKMDPLRRAAEAMYHQIHSVLDQWERCKAGVMIQCQLPGSALGAGAPRGGGGTPRFQGHR